MEEYDPIVDPIREARHRISERFDHDLKRLAEYYRKLDREDPAQLAQPGSEPAVPPTKSSEDT